MLHVVGTARETDALKSKLPDEVFETLVWAVGILDYEYGKERNYLKVGGYYLVAETAADVLAMKGFVDFENHPCEWANLSKNGSYVSALYLMNNDFSITLLLPVDIAPESILVEVDDSPS